MRNERLHTWFGLSYASYLVLPRALLQELPNDLQERLATLLEEVEEHFNDTRIYSILVRDPKTGRFCQDPLTNYRHPDQIAINRLRIAGNQFG